MNTRVLTTLSTLTVGAVLLAGCGTQGDSNLATPEPEPTEEQTTQAQEPLTYTEFLSELTATQREFLTELRQGAPKVEEVIYTDLSDFLNTEHTEFEAQTFTYSSAAAHDEAMEAYWSPDQTLELEWQAYEEADWQTVGWYEDEEVLEVYEAHDATTAYTAEFISGESTVDFSAIQFADEQEASDWVNDRFEDIFPDDFELTAGNFYTDTDPFEVADTGIDALLWWDSSGVVRIMEGSFLQINNHQDADGTVYEGLAAQGDFDTSLLELE